MYDGMVAVANEFSNFIGCENVHKLGKLLKVGLNSRPAVSGN